MKSLKTTTQTALLAAVCVVLIGLVVQSFIGTLPHAANPYNSYALQAQRWLAGHLDLGQNYSHLEIAAYGGRYFISFPPFPSVVLLPFVLLFGTNTPDHLLALLCAALGAVYACKIAAVYGKDAQSSLFWSLFVTVGGNLLFLLTRGWVWFFAQTLAFTLCMAAVYYTVATKKRALPLLLLACAVGCRPFALLYFPLFIYLLRQRGETWKSLALAVLPAVCVGILYMLLNYLRFHNPFEFGHNYLPEFAAEKQFSFAYLGENLKTLFRLPTLADGGLQYPQFNGFAFFIASPLYIAYAVFLARYGRKKSDFLLPLLLAAHLLLLCAHRTMGGWQFGHRYTVDLLPFVFLGVMQLTKGRDDPRWTRVLFLGGLVLNACGTVLL